METHWLEFISRHQTDGIIHKYVIRLSKFKKKKTWSDVILKQQRKHGSIQNYSWDYLDENCLYR